MDQQGWASPPSLPPAAAAAAAAAAADLQSSDLILQQQLMQLLHTHDSSHLGGGGAKDQHGVEHISTIPSAKRSNDCNPSSAKNDISIFDQEGNWLEDDKLLPFKKRRILNLDYLPRKTTAILQREVKNIGNARPSRKCTKKIWADHVVNYKDDNFKKVPKMINSPAGKNIVMGENVINNSTSRRCTRTSGKGWRCSQPAFAGYSMCEHHWISTKNSRRMERMKNNTTASKLIASQANITPTSSCKTLSQREHKNVGKEKKSIKCTNKIWPDHVFKKNADFEGVADVMNSTTDAEKVKMEGKTIDNSTRRCTRTNGKGWRCSKPSIAGSSMCENHITARRNERKNNNSSPPAEGAGSKVKITLKSSTTLLQRENMDIGNARSSIKCTNKDDDDHCDFEGVADVMNGTTSAAKRMKMEEKMIDNNITTRRCIRSNGRHWRCPRPSFAGYPLCEYHWAAKNNWAATKRKKKNTIPLRKAAASEVYYPTSTSKFPVLDTGLNSLDIQDSDDHNDVLPKRRIAAVKARSISSLIH